MAPVPDNSALSIFDQAWQFADTEYSFFELKGIDWDTAYQEHVTQIRDGMSEEELFEVVSDMLYLLEDGHVNLRSTFDFSRNWRWYLDHPQNFDFSLLERNYWNEEQQYVGPFTVYDFDDVVYARYASFSYSFAPEHLDYLFTEFAERDGFILDVRNNGGGSINNAYRIANRLVDEPTFVGAEEFKNGPGHDDFSDPVEVLIAPPEEGTLWTKPFVILTNRSSYSATNLLVALVVDLPAVSIIGDTTGGGGGIPTFTELTNGWIVRVSAHRFKASVPFQDDLFDVELGIPPDIDIDLDPADQANGVDTILEAALAYIRGL